MTMGGPEADTIKCLYFTGYIIRESMEKSILRAIFLRILYEWVGAGLGTMILAEN